MKTILIPFDSSAASYNAVKYVSELIKHRPAERIVVLHTSHTSPYTQLFYSADYVQMNADQIENERRQVEDVLRNICGDLRKAGGREISIEYAIQEQFQLRSLLDAIGQVNPSLVVVGFNRSNSDGFSSEQVISIGKASPSPVLIVPSEAHYIPAKQALVPVNLSKISRLTLLKDLGKIRLSNLQLMILNVDPANKHREYNEETEQSINAILENWDYKLYYSGDKNIAEGILKFAEERKAEMLIALPGKHSFFYSLTHRSITSALALNSDKPVLLMK